MMSARRFMQFAFALFMGGALALTSGCSSTPSGNTASGADSPTTTASPTSTAPATTVPIDRYSKYLELTEQLGGDVIAKEDAVIRASLDCSGAAKDMMGGISITEFPTDLALVRAYCPDKEADL